MIRRKLRGQTLVVDISYEIAAAVEASLANAIRDLKDKLDLNVELADPSQFLPVPKGRESRCTYAGRYGKVDVFLDDPYTVALSKLHRGYEKDLDDVRLLVRANFVDLGEVEKKLREIAAPETPGSARVDLVRLLARLEFTRGVV